MEEHSGTDSSPSKLLVVERESPGELGIGPPFPAVVFSVKRQADLPFRLPPYLVRRPPIFANGQSLD